MSNEEVEDSDGLLTWTTVTHSIRPPTPHSDASLRHGDFVSADNGEKTSERKAERSLAAWVIQKFRTSDSGAHQRLRAASLGECRGQDSSAQRARRLGWMRRHREMEAGGAEGVGLG